ncbi:hypothetical protein TRVL_06451 [Trypanosoma vivax]|nr:hypothetical protein TRVL_06451 [Trypanosoma vivax]
MYFTLCFAREGVAFPSHSFYWVTALHTPLLLIFNFESVCEFAFIIPLLLPLPSQTSVQTSQRNNSQLRFAYFGHSTNVLGKLFRDVCLEMASRVSEVVVQ